MRNENTGDMKNKIEREISMNTSTISNMAVSRNWSPNF